MNDKSNKKPTKMVTLAEAVSTKPLADALQGHGKQKQDEKTRIADKLKRDNPSQKGDTNPEDQS